MDLSKIVEALDKTLGVPCVVVGLIFGLYLKGHNRWEV
jgi:hypothetical protein